MSKYYRVKQDTPAWDKGAVLEERGEHKYYAISDLWNTKGADLCEAYFETSEVIENAPEWFERVYEINILGKAKYLTKEAAKAVHEKLHRGPGRPSKED